MQTGPRIPAGGFFCGNFLSRDLGEDEGPDKGSWGAGLRSVKSGAGNEAGSTGEVWGISGC